MHIVTGFEPFRGAPLNPAMAMAHLVAEQTPATALELPVTFHGAFNSLRDQLTGHNPTSFLLLGRAAGEPGLRIEQYGRRDCTSPHPDNQGHYGHQAHFEPGPEKLASTVDLTTLTKNCQTAAPQCPSHISTNAGGYVCNALYYQTLLHFPQTPVVFVHLDGLHHLTKATTLPPEETTDNGELVTTQRPENASWAQLTAATIALARTLHTA